ncbi:uncharacterized protein [Clytia hemisphaerica]|uniref:Tetraspanin family protein n=1 Tax=Clytia hemisphaerica TaxID=252671 RepID=A0A7M5WL12_9CNID
MTRQWADNHIEKKPGNRYNPSLQNKLAPVYKLWLGVVGIFSCILGVASICVCAVLKSKDDQLDNEFYQLWVGIPLVIYALFAILNAIFPDKKLTVFLVVMSFIMAGICLAGIFGAGFSYWKDGYRQVGITKWNKHCGDVDGFCVCDGIETMPKDMKCDDMDDMINLIFVEIALSALGFIISIMGLFVSFMGICCTPWVYFEMYDPRYDYDFGNETPGSTPIKYSPHTGNGGHDNHGFGAGAKNTAPFY